jgi:hypothetical protein
MRRYYGLGIRALQSSNGESTARQSLPRGTPARRNQSMRRKMIVALFALLVATVVSARDHSYEKGKILSMDSSPCGMAEKSNKTIAGEVLGTDADHKNTQEVLCPEYVVQGEHVLYHVRPDDTKHPVLLPVGEDAEFRISKDKMMLRVRESSDEKEHSYSVVSMTPHDADPAVAQTGSK